MARKDKKQSQPTIDHDAPTARNISFLDDQEEGNAYAASVDEGHRVDPRAQKVFVLVIILIAVYVFGLIVPKDLLNEALHNSGYASGYNFSWFVEDLLSNVNSLVGVFTGNDNGAVAFSSTMIRYVVIAVTGAGLALCGAVYQGTFKNALVSPSTLGVSSGASLGMMLWFIFFVDENATNVAWLDTYTGDPTADPVSYLISSYSLSCISFAGCLVVVGIVLLTLVLSNRKNKGSSASPIMMIICGQVIGSVVGAFTNEVRYYYIADNPYSMKAQLLTDMMVQSFYRNFTWIDIVAIMIPLIATVVVVMALRNKMMIVSMGQDEARTLGVDTRRMRYLLIGLCTLLTAILISFCGQVGFVGFLVPHLARRLVGPNFNYLLPASLALGGVFVLGAYVLLAMTLGPSYENMVGMFISIGGAAVFLVTALRGKGGARGEFR